MHKAINNDNLEQVKKILRRGKFNEPSPGSTRHIQLNSHLSEKSFLHMACEEGRYSIVHELLEFNHKVNITDSCNYTPLQRAVEGGHSDCVQLLIEYRADLSVRDGFGNTPLHTAVISGSVEIVNMLIDAGISLESHNHKGDTPLHLACSNKSELIAELLLSAGAHVNCVDSDGNTALMLSCIEGNELVTKLLLSYNANTTVRNNLGMSAHDLAESNQKSKCLNLLSNKNSSQSPTIFDTSVEKIVDVDSNPSVCDATAYCSAKIDPNQSDDAREVARSHITTTEAVNHIECQDELDHKEKVESIKSTSLLEKSLQEEIKCPEGDGGSPLVMFDYEQTKHDNIAITPFPMSHINPITSKLVSTESMESVKSSGDMHEIMCSIDRTCDRVSRGSFPVCSEDSHSKLKRFESTLRQKINQNIINISSQQTFRNFFACASEKSKSLSKSHMSIGDKNVNGKSEPNHDGKLQRSISAQKSNEFEVKIDQVCPEQNKILLNKYDMHINENSQNFVDEVKSRGCLTSINSSILDDPTTISLPSLDVCAEFVNEDAELTENSIDLVKNEVLDKIEVDMPKVIEMKNHYTDSKLLQEDRLQYCESEHSECYSLSSITFSHTSKTLAKIHNEMRDESQLHQGSYFEPCNVIVEKESSPKATIQSVKSEFSGVVDSCLEQQPWMEEDLINVVIQTNAQEDEEIVDLTQYDAHTLTNMSEPRELSIHSTGKICLNSMKIFNSLNIRNHVNESLSVEEEDENPISTSETKSDELTPVISEICRSELVGLINNEQEILRGLENLKTSENDENHLHDLLTLKKTLELNEKQIAAREIDTKRIQNLLHESDMRFTTLVSKVYQTNKQTTNETCVIEQSGSSDPIQSTNLSPVIETSFSNVVADRLNGLYERITAMLDEYKSRSKTPENATVNQSRPRINTSIGTGEIRSKNVASQTEILKELDGNHNRQFQQQSVGVQNDSILVRSENIQTDQLPRKDARVEVLLLEDWVKSDIGARQKDCSEILLDHGADTDLNGVNATVQTDPDSQPSIKPTKTVKLSHTGLMHTISIESIIDRVDSTSTNESSPENLMPRETGKKIHKNYHSFDMDFGRSAAKNNKWEYDSLSSKRALFWQHRSESKTRNCDYAYTRTSLYGPPGFSLTTSAMLSNAEENLKRMRKSLTRHRFV